MICDCCCENLIINDKYFNCNNCKYKSCYKCLYDYLNDENNNGLLCPNCNTSISLEEFNKICDNSFDYNKYFINELKQIYNNPIKYSKFSNKFNKFGKIYNIIFDESKQNSYNLFLKKIKLYELYNSLKLNSLINKNIDNPNFKLNNKSQYDEEIELYTNVINKEISKHDYDRIGYKRILLQNILIKLMNYKNSDPQKIESKIIRLIEWFKNPKSYTKYLQNKCEKYFIDFEKHTKNKYFSKCFNCCNGYLEENSNENYYKCTSCEKLFCTKCFEVINRKNINKNHKCKEENLNYAKLIYENAKSCPNCYTLIMKSTGCNDMFCTECKTSFDWITGEIINFNVHNPIRMQYINEHPEFNDNSENDTPISRYLSLQDLINDNNINRSEINLYKNIVNKIKNNDVEIKLYKKNIFLNILLYLQNQQPQPQQQNCNKFYNFIMININDLDVNNYDIINNYILLKRKLLNLECENKKLNQLKDTLFKQLASYNQLKLELFDLIRIHEMSNYGDFVRLLFYYITNNDLISLNYDEIYRNVNNNNNANDNDNDNSDSSNSSDDESDESDDIDLFNANIVRIVNNYELCKKNYSLHFNNLINRIHYDYNYVIDTLQNIFIEQFQNDLFEKLNSQIRNLNNLINTIRL